MKVLLKSLKELELEYDIEKIDNYLIIGSNIVDGDTIIPVLGKVVEAKYDKVSDSYIINDYWFHPNFIKGEVIDEEIKYTIKRLGDGIEYDFIVVK